METSFNRQSGVIRLAVRPRTKSELGRWANG